MPLVELSAREAVEKSLAAIARDDGHLRAMIHVDPANARARAAAVDSRGGVLPLRGLVFAAKDLIEVAGLPATAGSRLFDASNAAEDATCVRLLEAAGAVVIGKSNMHELAVGSARNPWYGQVKNPLSDEHGTGGTSSGSAAAVAAGFCAFALGTDSGGSNRSTAAATGIYGYKPTNGMLSLAGVRSVAPTLDTLGLLARDGNILAKAFAALAGEVTGAAEVRLAGKVFGRPVNLSGSVDATVDAAVRLAEAIVLASGGTLVEIAFGDAPALMQAGRDILRYEFAREYGHEIAAKPERVSVEVLAFAEAAKAVSASQYEDALAVVERQRQSWHTQLETVDALMLATAPGLAPRLEDEHTRVGDRWVPYGPAGAEFRMWANTIGIPAIAIPIARTRGLPASIQLAGRPRADGFLIDLSAALGREIGERSAAQPRGELS